MWKKIAPLLIILSASLNIAFIGVWAIQASPKNPVDREQCGYTGGISCPLHRNLEITDEQWTELEPRLTRFRCESDTLCQDIQRISGELIDLIALPQPDIDAIAAKQKEILAIQSKMQERVIAHLLAEKQILTEEQQARLFRMIKEKTGCTGRNTMACPGAIPGVQLWLQSDSKTGL